MATHGKLTVEKLKKFLDAFEDDTAIVMGDARAGPETHECHINTYYPAGREEEWPLLVIDVNRNSEVPAHD